MKWLNLFAPQFWSAMVNVRLHWSSGGGGGGTTQYNWNDDMAPYWKDALAAGKNLSQTPYQPYTGQRIADINKNQQDAFAGIRDFAEQSGNDATRAANGNIYQTLSGDYLSGDKTNPWAIRNPEAGMDSPYFKSMLSSGRQDITDAYQRGTSADTTRMFNLAGAFGGSAHQNAVAANEVGLGRTLSNFESGAQNDQYNRTAQLDEGMLNRGNQDYESERQRQMSALAPGQNEQALALQRYNAVLGVGDAQRGYSQDLLNQKYNDFTTAKQYPYTQLDYLTGLMSRAQGGMSPNSATQSSGYSASPFSQILGAGLGAYGLTR